MPMDINHPYPDPYPYYLGRVWVTHLLPANLSKFYFALFSLANSHIQDSTTPDLQCGSDAQNASSWSRFCQCPTKSSPRPPLSRQGRRRHQRQRRRRRWCQTLTTWMSQPRWSNNSIICVACGHSMEEIEETLRKKHSQKASYLRWFLLLLLLSSAKLHLYGDTGTCNLAASNALASASNSWYAPFIPIHGWLSMSASTAMATLQCTH